MPVGYSIYVDRPSYIHHRLDPRTKLAALGAVFVLALSFNHPAVLGAFVLLVLVAGRLAQVGWRSMAPFLAGSVWFLVLGVVIWPLYVQGGPDLFTVAGQTITLNGLLFGLAMGLRVAWMVTAAGVWMMTTSPQRLTVGLLHLGLPYKAGVAMTAAIRFVPLLNAERATIVEAQQARALDVAQGLALAMDARGFGVRDGRTSIVELHLTRTDRAIMIGLLVASIVAVGLRLLGIGLITRDYL